LTANPPNPQVSITYSNAITPSNVIENFVIDFNTATGSAVVNVFSNSWVFTGLGQGTNQTVALTYSLAADSPNSAVIFGTSVPGFMELVLTNGVSITSGQITKSAASFSGIGAPSLMSIVTSAQGWAPGLTPASATPTHWTGWGTIVSRY
jgi:hypothetical protein